MLVEKGVIRDQNDDMKLLFYTVRLLVVRLIMQIDENGTMETSTIL